MQLPAPGEIIDQLGGTTAVANLLGIKPPSVSEWRQKDRIPEGSLVRLAIHIERKMGIPRKDICPEVFGSVRRRS